MNYCIEIPMGMWAFLGLLGTLTALVWLGCLIAAFFERRGAHIERQQMAAKRKVFVSGAVRVGPRMVLPAKRPAVRQAANDPDHRS